MKLLIIRHGESEADILDVCEGRADFPLTARGHRQAEAMAQWVTEHHRPDALVASPLTRAQQTAEHIARATGLAPATDDDLMEFNNGLIAGLSREEAAEKYPWHPELPLHEAEYAQESQLEFRLRAERALSRLLNGYSEDSTVAVVTHGGMIGQLYRAFLRLPVDAAYAFYTGDTGVHIWHVENGRRAVEAANLIVHAE